jgi:two-component system, NtrC family, sensor histidine kinase PilS
LWRRRAAKAKSPSAQVAALYSGARRIAAGDCMAAIRPDHPASSERIAASTRQRELYFFALYRTLQSVLYMFLAYSTLALNFATLQVPVLAKVSALVYLLVATLLLLARRSPHLPLMPQVMAALTFDIAAAMIAIHAFGQVENGISLLLIVNIGAGALLLRLRWSMAFSIAAAAALIIEYLYSTDQIGAGGRNFAEVLMIGATYIAATILCRILARQVSDSNELAAQRGAEVANLAQLNELIIRRMRTGVLVVDAGGTIQLINESAWAQLGQPSPAETSLTRISEELARRLYQWRFENASDTRPIELSGDSPPIVPRFARLTVTDELFLIFLDDSSLVARRAEELTLSSLGRLSASIAHEIRNPLAAISYSAQLLEESPALPEADRRLAEIIVSHCNRMNGIIENVLNLSRRERSRPESVDLAQWIFQFVDDFKTGRYLDRDELKAVTQHRSLHAMVDPQQLHQAVTNLVQNALNYGHLSGEPARITITARQLNDSSPPLVEVIDRGPGIPARVADNIFEPFFTTHEHGTGLGLYLARQLCEANQATLEYVPVAGGGSCFRISLAHARNLHSSVGPRRTVRSA